jgi:hypothetical protein
MRCRLPAFGCSRGLRRVGGLVRPEDRPSDFGVPGVVIFGVEKPLEVVLAERAVDVDLVLHDVAAEVAISEVDVCEGAVVADDGDLGAGNDDRGGATYRACRSFDRDEDGRVAAVVFEDLGAVEAPERSGLS